MPLIPKVMKNSNKVALTKRNNETMPTHITKKNDTRHESVLNPTTKRPAECQLSDIPNSKRSVLGDLTNAVGVVNEDAKAKAKKTSMVPEKRPAIASYAAAITKPVLRSQNVVATVVEPKAVLALVSACQKVPAQKEVPVAAVPVATEQRRSLRVREQKDRMVTSAPDDAADASFVTAPESLDSSLEADESTLEDTTQRKRHVSLPVVPEGVLDFDRETAMDPFSVPHYAQEIFLYFKERESKFAVPKYMERQLEVTRSVRAVLVDWMAEVQESFELNHETLYLAVKLVDMYLSRCHVDKNRLQLVGSTSMLIAAKFDERSPPIVDDFLYICDDAYDRPQLLQMEIDILHAVDFDLGVPLSYSYLRRFARCSKQSMEMLTLSRYILELSLLEYELIDVSESLIAAAALSLALQMKQKEAWSPTLEHYSGYKLAELKELIKRLNELVVNAKTKNLNTIPKKYSHEVFFEVSNVAPLNLNECP